MKRKSCGLLKTLSLVFAASVCAMTASVRAAPPATATVQVSGERLGPVNRAVLGQNILGYQALPKNASQAELASIPEWMMKDRPFYAMRAGGLWDPAANAPAKAMLSLLSGVAKGSSLRWPGGCGSHEFNWKRAVGPLKDRPEQAFGLPEFLRLCEAINAEPVITMADYWGEPEDFADLVEYLNSPQGGNPNGGRDWAAVRAADGHPAPYGVKFFEAGNESDHGVHKERLSSTPAPLPLTADAYSARFLKVSAAMKAVDSSVKVGAVLGYDASPEFIGPWSESVIKGTGRVADFFIYHVYTGVKIEDDATSPETVYSHGFVSARQQKAVLELLNSKILEWSGRKIPLAVTEHNGGYVQERPFPYRFCLGTAVQDADLLQVLLSPSLGIANAQYWQFCNEYWGALSGTDEGCVKRPACFMFKIYAGFLGDEVAGAKVSCGSFDMPETGGVPRASGAPESDVFSQARPLDGIPWEIQETPGVVAKTGPDGLLDVSVESSNKLNYYHASKRIPAKPSTLYLVTAEVKAERFSKGAPTIQAGDGRGYDRMKSCANSNSANSSEWMKTAVLYTTLPDASELEIVARRRESAEPTRFQVRNLEVRERRPCNLGSTPFISAFCSTDSASGETCLVLVNRSLSENIETWIECPRGVSSGRAETLSGPALESMNDEKSSPVGLKSSPVDILSGKAKLTLPPFSVTGVRLK